MTTSEAIRIHLLLSASGLGSKFLARPQFLHCCLPPSSFPFSATTRDIHSVSSHHHCHHSSTTPKLYSLAQEPLRVKSLPAPFTHYKQPTHHTQLLFKPTRPSFFLLHHHRSLALVSTPSTVPPHLTNLDLAIKTVT